MLTHCPLAWIRQELCGRPPGRVEGIARPGWLAALPSPPDRGEEDGAEAGRMTDSPRRCWSLSIGGEVGRWLRPEADEVAALPLVLVLSLPSLLYVFVFPLYIIRYI